MKRNNKLNKANAYRLSQEVLRNKALSKGVNLIAPETIFLSKDTSFGKNVTIEPYVVFGPKVQIGDTFSFNKPDPRHLTDVVEIVGGDLKKTIMVGDSEVDANSAHNANLPFVLVKDGYTEKSEKEIKHDELISDFIGFDKVIEKYL